MMLTRYLARFVVLALVLLWPRPAAAQLDALTNVAACVVSTGYDAAATSIDVAAGCGATLPSVPFNVSWCDTTTYPINCRNASGTIDPNYEVVRVTNISTDTLTITRAQESTSASTKNTGASTYWLSTFTAKTITDINTALGATFLTTSTNSVLTNEAVLAGTADQVILTGSTLSLPQSIATTSTPTFGGGAFNGLVQVNSTATPGFQIIGDGGSASKFHEAYGASANPIYRYRRARGTLAAPLRAKSGDILGNIQFWGAEAATDVAAASFGVTNAVFRVTAAEDMSSTSRGTKFEFLPTAIGGTANSLAATISSTGVTLESGRGLFGTSTLDLGVGSTSYAALTSSALTLGSNVNAALAGNGLVTHSGNLFAQGTTGMGLRPGGSATGNGNGLIWMNASNNAGGGGTDANQMFAQFRSPADSVNGYFNPLIRWAATDGTNTGADVGEFGVEGNWSNAGGYTLRRIYLWDFVRKSGSGATIFRWEDSAPTFFFFGGDDVELHPHADNGRYWSQYFADSTASGGLSTKKYRGTAVADLRRALASDVLGLFESYGGEAADNATDATLGSAASASLRFEALADHTTTNHYAKAVIATAGSGSTTLTDRATFSSTGLTIGATTAARGTTDPTGALNLYNNTAPVGTLTNGGSVYVEGGEIKVMDSGGTATTISPHDDDTGEWVFYSENTVTGKRMRVDMERMMKKLDALLGGGFVTEFIDPEYHNSTGRAQGRVVFSRFPYVPYPMSVQAAR